MTPKPEVEGHNKQHLVQISTIRHFHLYYSSDQTFKASTVMRHRL